jgi:phosphate transport system protein
MAEESAPLRELRRPYHDRIAEVRRQSLAVLACAISVADRGTRALLDGSCEPPEEMRQAAEQAGFVGASIDTEVVNLLALESPVARDLRVILAARDVTQTALLCIGLGITLSQASRASFYLGSTLRPSMGELGLATSSLLDEARSAWASLDTDRAREVEQHSELLRTQKLSFFGELAGLQGVPMDAALDLGVASRVYERLADHAVEIAERVLFAVEGLPTTVRPQL